jgi:cyclophilin family peptidyl-prolyl cis-trans isomerase
MIKRFPLFIKNWMLLVVLVATLTVLPGSLVSGSTFVRLDYNLNLNTRFQNAAFIELFDDRPITTTNFLQYVDGNLYDGTIMHRLVSNFVLQGGGFYEDPIALPAPLNVALGQDEVDLDGNPATDNPTILNEFGNAPFRSNARGTLAMAKVGGNPNSATNQFFFNLSNNAGTPPNGLDFQNGGFTVFAQVVGNGMALIDGLASLQKTNLNNDLVTQAANGSLVNNNPDGVRDFGNFAGPFTDVPFLGGNLVRLETANRSDYFSSTSNTIIPTGNLTIANSLGFVEAGAVFSGTGKFVVGAGKTLSMGHGASIARPVEVAGTFDPGFLVGTVTASSYKQLAGSTLKMQLGGETEGTLFDQLNVTTTAEVAGSLNVFLLGSFRPSAGDTFSLINAASITGSFSSATLPTLRTGLAWDLQTTATSMKLVVLPDYNNNGTVDQGDLTVWQNNFGSTANLAADGDGDGKVDGQDFLLWQRHFGESSTLPPAPAITAVPEPTAFALAILGSLAACARRRTC